MDWHVPAMAAALCGSSILVLVYGHLWRHERDRPLGLWTAGWALYCLRFVAALAAEGAGPSPLLAVLHDLLTLWSGFLLLAGTYTFLGRPLSRAWLPLFLAGSGWTAWAAFGGVGPFAAALPLFAGLGAVYVWTGGVLLREERLPSAGRRLVGWSFVLWGLHKADYPFLRPLPAVAPWGFTVAACLELTTALGMLLLYFEQHRESLIATQHLLRASEERFRTLVRAAPVGIYRTGPQGYSTYVNERWCEVAGLRPEAAEGRGWQQVLHPDDRPRLASLWRDAVAARSVLHAEHRYLRPDGEVRWVLGRACPEVADDGTLVGYIGTVTDITDRVRAEEEVRELNTALERRVEERTAELLAANQELEAFAYSVSHDLRAPLRHVDGYSQALLEDFGDRLEGDARHYCERLRAASQHMGRLVDALLHLSRVTRAELKREEVDLSALARAAVERLRAGSPERAVEVSIEEGLQAEGDPRLLALVLENLLDNAWKYTARKAEAHIRFGAAEVGGERAYFVRDDGAGFDMAYAGKLFQPFQRLHAAEEFEGTGIGLATVQRIVRRHGGRVWAEAEVDRGATFSFTLSAGGGP